MTKEEISAYCSKIDNNLLRNEQYKPHVLVCVAKMVIAFIVAGFAMWYACKML